MDVQEVEKHLRDAARSVSAARRAAGGRVRWAPTTAPSAGSSTRWRTLSAGWIVSFEDCPGSWSNVRHRPIPDRRPDSAGRRNVGSDGRPVWRRKRSPPRK